MAMFGGVEANPAAAGATAALNDPTVVSRDPRTTALLQKEATPFKAKTAFDNAEASRLNAEHFGNELAADTQATRELRVLKDSIPFKLEERRGFSEIDVNEYKQKGDYDDTKKRSFEEFLSKLKLDEEGKLAVIDVLKRNNIIPTDFDEQQWISDINPARREEILAGSHAAKLKSQADASDIGRDQTTKELTFPTMLQTAQTKAGAEKQLTELQAADVPSAFADLKTRRDQELKANEANMVRGRFMNVGDQVVDIFANPARSIYSAPTPMERLQTRPTGSAPGVTSPATAAPSNDMVEVEVDGKKIRVSKSKAASLGYAESRPIDQKVQQARAIPPLIARPPELPEHTVMDTLGNSAGSLGRGLGKASDAVVSIPRKTVESLINGFISQFYKPAPAQPRR